MAAGGLDWKSVEWVLVDLDGTLLDKHFDHYFWNELIPKKYGELKKIPSVMAREIVFKKYRSARGGLKWYDLGYWSKKLGIDLISLTYQARHLAALHPDAERFLKQLKKHRKRVFLITNSHHAMAGVKIRRTGIEKYFDGVVSAFDVGLEKTDGRFWTRLEKKLGFDRQKTVVVDDDEKVLGAARRFGIKWLVLKTTRGFGGLARGLEKA